MSQPQGYQAGGYPNQPPSYAQQGAPNYGTNQAPHVTVVQPQQHIVVGGCPSCGAGQFSDNFTILGIILAILFFPIGILCCFLLMEKRCDRCGATF